MTMNEYSIFARGPGIEPHHQTQFGVMSRTLVRRWYVLPLCRDAVGEFNRYCRRGYIDVRGISKYRYITYLPARVSDFDLSLQNWCALIQMRNKKCQNTTILTYPGWTSHYFKMDNSLFSCLLFYHKFLTLQTKLFIMSVRKRK